MIQIPSHILASIVRQARAELPNECCGLLTGLEGVVRKQYPMTNTDHSPEHFSFDPREQFQVLKAARVEGSKIIANYHSHPSTPARPSEEDIRLAYDPNVVYIIVSLAEDTPVVKAFSIVEGMVKQLELNLIQVHTIPDQQ
jgi:proteasome lid subunit RPN8/RPN11